MSKSGRYKHWWYGAVRTALQHYDPKDNSRTCRELEIDTAILVTFRETAKMPDGDLRTKAVNMVYVKGTHNADGAAQALYTSRRTLQRWLTDFVYDVAEKLGYK